MNLARPDESLIVLKPTETLSPSFVSDHTSADFRILQEIIAGLDPNVTVAPSLAVVATDSRHYEGLTENTYRFLPIRVSIEDVKRIHGNDERISIENYNELVRFMIELLKRSSSADFGRGAPVNVLKGFRALDR